MSTHNHAWKKWGGWAITGIVILGACGPFRGCGAADSSVGPQAQIVRVNATTTVDGMGFDVFCDQQRHVLIYVGDNYRMAAVPGGC